MTTLFNRQGKERQANAGTEAKPAYYYVSKCGRCGGLGARECWAHTGSTCYDCGGTGRGVGKTETLYTAEKLAKLNATAAKRQATELAKRQAEAARVEAERAAIRSDWEAANADMLAKARELVAADTGDFWRGFVPGMVQRVFMSDRQAEVINEAHARMTARRAAEAVNHLYGEPGKRARGVAVTVGKSIFLGTNDFCYPPKARWLVLMTTGCGAKLSWFTDHKETEGAAVAAFTVKEHGEYKGQPQTIVQRVAFEAVAEPATTE